MNNILILPNKKQGQGGWEEGKGGGKEAGEGEGEGEESREEGG